MSNDIFTKIGELFSEEYKNVLEYEQGSRRITVDKSLRNLFGDYYQRYSDDDTLDIAAQIIQNNRHLIYKIVLEEDNLKKLSDPNSFKESVDTNTERGQINKTTGYERKEHIKENLLTTLDNEGTGQRSRDYENIEGFGDLEHRKFIATDKTAIATGFREVKHEAATIEFSKSFEEDSKSLNNLTQEASPDKFTPQVPEFENECQKVDMRQKPSINLFATSRTTSKNVNRRLAGYEQSKGTGTRAKTKQNMKVFTEAETIKKSMNVEVPILRDRFFQSFYILFSNYPCQY